MADLCLDGERAGHARLRVERRGGTRGLASRAPDVAVQISNRSHHWAAFFIDKCLSTHYIFWMIRSFRHRGLKRFYERGDRSLIRPDLHDRVEAMLAQLDVASSPNAMRLPHYRLHALKGKLKGYWSVTVKANWRIIFRFEGEDVHEVELIDYH